MKKIDLGQTATVVANLAVVAGIIFLAIEVRQNQATLEEGNAMNLMIAQDTAQQHYSALRSLLLENEDLLIAWEKGLAAQDLTELEHTKFDVLCVEQIFRHATIHRGMDLLGRQMEAANAASVIRTNRIRSELFSACWEGIRSAVLEGGFVEFVSLVDSNE